MEKAPKVVCPGTELIGEKRKGTMGRSNMFCRRIPRRALAPSDGGQCSVKIGHPCGKPAAQTATESAVEGFCRAVECARPAAPVSINQVRRRARARYERRTLIGQGNGRLSDETKLSQGTEMRSEHSLRTLIDQQRTEESRGCVDRTGLRSRPKDTGESIASAVSPIYLEATLPMQEVRSALHVRGLLFRRPSNENEAPEKFFMTPGAAGETGHEAVAQLLSHPVEAERVRRAATVVLRRPGPKNAVEHRHAR